MELKNAQVLITGGTDGIGKALAVRLMLNGSKVMVTGRNDEKLSKVAKEIPGLLAIKNNIADPQQREWLAEQVLEKLPGLNVIINNAGVQRRLSLSEDNADWDERQNEIDTLLSAPVHLNHLLIPHLIKSHRPALIVNVTSGGAFIPQVFAPIYSSSKAALHHYTIILRDALRDTNVRIAELIPPAVQTSLAGKQKHGAPLEEFADDVFKKIFVDDNEAIGYQATENLHLEINGRSQDELFKESSQRFPIKRYQI